MAESVSAHDYLPAFHFKVMIGKDEVAFKEVSGLDVELETEDVMEGGGYGYVYRLPKPAKSKNLVLKRALQKSPDELYEWITNALDNFIFDLRDVIVTLVDEKDQNIKKWQFFGAYPLKVSYGSLDSLKSELVIQTLELAYSSRKYSDVA
ncbi:MAG: phage tail protein [Bacteroidales bacterium]|nr:phage tail protein [Bacteroidales bacterium]